jgi:hypothetical protein
MSVLVSSLIDRALVKLMDPGARRYKREAMLQYFNEIQHEFATSLRCFEDDYYFNLEANEGAYSYPPNRVQLKKVRITQNPSPTSLADYYPLDEWFEEEFTGATALSRPSGYIHHYFARSGWFELIEMPAADIINGGIVTTYRIPLWLDTEEPNTLMELPDFTQVAVQHGMEILARYAGRDRAAGNSDWERWKLEMADMDGKISDPSVDRRASVRPPRGYYRGGMR